MLDPTKIEHAPLSEYGYIMVIAMVILASIITLIIRTVSSDRKMRFSQRSIDEFIKAQTPINAQLSQAIVLLTRDRISECTLSQVKILSRSVIDSFLMDITYGIMDVIDKNQLHKKNVVVNRIDVMVGNAVKCAISYSDNFIYEGKPLSFMIDECLWVDATKQLSMEVVYTEMDKLLLLHREAKELKETLSNNFYDNLKNKFNAITPQNIV